jgi:hypothetical protein
MFKTKHNLILFKKLSFLLFYSGFITFFYLKFTEYSYINLSDFQTLYIISEMLIICLAGFYLNCNLFAKTLFQTKHYLSFIVKNIISIIILMAIWYYFRITIGLNLPVLSNALFTISCSLLLFTVIVSLFYADWIFQIENKAAMYRTLKEKKNLKSNY